MRYYAEIVDLKEYQAKEAAELAKNISLVSIPSDAKIDVKVVFSWKE